jgi:hypothetical protein
MNFSHHAPEPNSNAMQGPIRGYYPRRKANSGPARANGGTAVANRSKLTRRSQPGPLQPPQPWEPQQGLRLTAQLRETGSNLETWCAREAGVNAGESPAGAIRRFSTEDRANCVAARRGGEQAWSRIPQLRDCNEHMKHINEPRKTTPGSRAPQVWAKAEEPRPRPTVVGHGNGPAGSACATCWEVTLG